MANAKWLVDLGTRERIAAYCGKCGQIYPLSLFLAGRDDALLAAERAASQCCELKKCDVCGKTVQRKHYSRCDECSAADEQKKEEYRFQKARKVSWDVYDSEPHGSMVCYNDEYYSDFDELRESLYPNPMPEYVWGTTSERMKLDAREIIDNACEFQDMHEDAAQDISEDAEKELQAFLDAWCAAHSPTSYFCDFSIAVVLSDKERGLLDEDADVDDEES